MEERVTEKMKRRGSVFGRETEILKVKGRERERERERKREREREK